MLGHIEFRRLAFVTHVSLAPLALVFGSLQLLPRLRARGIRWCTAGPGACMY
jgi:hypothetical protein